MRFPSGWDPVITGVKETDELKEVGEVQPVKPGIGQAPTPPARLPARQSAEPAPQASAPPPSIERRSGEDRRKQARREAQDNIMLDTRAGRDRRRQLRRRTDEPTSVETKA